jgi:hypothetical protein
MSKNTRAPKRAFGEATGSAYNDPRLMSWTDIAAVLGISRQAAEQIGRRGMRKVEARFAELGLDRRTLADWLLG